MSGSETISRNASSYLQEYCGQDVRTRRLCHSSSWTILRHSPPELFRQVGPDVIEDSTHHVHKLLHFSFALRADLAHFQRDQGIKVIALPTTRTCLRCRGPTRSWECIPSQTAPLVSASVSHPSWAQAPSSTPCMPPVSVQGHARPLQGSPRVWYTVSSAFATLHVRVTYRLHAREDLPGRRADALQDVARPSPLTIVHTRELGL